MGSDLILVWCHAPVNTQNQQLPPSDDLFRQIDRRIDELPTQVLLRVVEARFGETITPDPDGTISADDEEYLDNAIAAPDETTWRDAVRGMLKTAAWTALDSRRDINIFKVDACWAIFTGGMSGGDNPTDAWDDIVMLAESGVTIRPFDLPAPSKRPT